jgi:hypothetical protein
LYEVVRGALNTDVSVDSPIDVPKPTKCYRFEKARPLTRSRSPNQPRSGVGYGENIIAIHHLMWNVMSYCEARRRIKGLP